MQRFSLPPLVAFVAVAVAGTAAAQPAVNEGRRLAEQWCASCHAIAPGARPPAGDAAPGFPAIAAMPSTTEMGLRVFLQTPHRNMPNYQFSRAELDALVAYLLAQKR